MSETPLSSAVERFAAVTLALADRDLVRPWAWQAYDEGVRHAFFRTYEELRELAAHIEAERNAQSQPVTPAQRALAQHHLAYRDLLAVLLGISDEQAALPPAEGEWPLRQVVVHTVRTERTFYALSLYAVKRQRAGSSSPLEMPEEDWNAFWVGDPFNDLAAGGELSDLLTYYAGLHWRVLTSFTEASAADLEAPSLWWEGEPMRVEFRLHRFDSHLRQHIIQAEKTLAALDIGPSEARRLLRLVYAALGEVEGMQIGAPDAGAPAAQALADTLLQRTEEVVAALAGE